jgi:hypothetical protein
MSFTSDGTRLATAGSEDENSGRGGGVKLWDLASGQSSGEVVIWNASQPEAANTDSRGVSNRR